MGGAGVQCEAEEWAERAAHTVCQGLGAPHCSGGRQDGTLEGAGVWHQRNGGQLSAKPLGGFGKSPSFSKPRLPLPGQMASGELSVRV